jgi:hypothetical protein
MNLSKKFRRVSGAFLAAAALFFSLPEIWPSSQCLGAERRTEFVMLVTSDGLRWQELFTGADERLIDSDVGGVKDPDDLRRRYWHEDAKVRRERLMPFFWNTIAAGGQVFGAPEADSRALVTNGLNFSYPGYQEVLCGFPDPAIDSNDKKNNANVSVLEWLNRQEAYRGRVAAFTSWEVFPYILNVKRSGLMVNAGWQAFEHFRDETALASVNRLMSEAPRFAPAARQDSFTTLGAMEYLQLRQPDVFYVSLDETDEWCHAGRYDLYLDAARRADHFLEELWSWISKSEKYAGKTSLVVTTDHGRGDGREGWKSHGKDYPGSDRIWIAVLGPDTPPMGLRQNVDVTQGQVAATVAALLGEDFTTVDSRIRPPLPGVLKEQATASRAQQNADAEED